MINFNLSLNLRDGRGANSEHLERPGEQQVLALLAAMRVVVTAAIVGVKGAAIVFMLCMLVVVSVVVLVSSSPDPAPTPTTRISAPRAAAGTHCTRL